MCNVLYISILVTVTVVLPLPCPLLKRHWHDLDSTMISSIQQFSNFTINVWGFIDDSFIDFCMCFSSLSFTKWRFVWVLGIYYFSSYPRYYLLNSLFFVHSVCLLFIDLTFHLERNSHWPNFLLSRCTSDVLWVKSHTRRLHSYSEWNLYCCVSPTFLFLLFSIRSIRVVFYRTLPI